VCETVASLIFEEDSPKLQALLRVVTARVKAINQQAREEDKKIKDEFKYENYQQIANQLLSLADPLAYAIKKENADVRKCAVFCLVEVHGILGDELFASFKNKLNPSQQKLVDIYITRKRDMARGVQMMQC